MGRPFADSEQQVLFKVSGARDPKSEVIVGDLEAKYNVRSLVPTRQASHTSTRRTRRMG
jgi:hypothetical protein